MQSVEEVINEIILVGKNESYQEMEFIDPRVSDGRLLWDHGEEFWNKICVDLTLEEIITLLKSMVYADGRFKNWSTYSVMHYCFYLLCILRERSDFSYQEYDNLLNWIFKSRRNSYIPYIGGNIPLHISSIEEYRIYSEACKEEYQRHQEDKQKEYEEAQIRKKARKDSAIKNKENNLIAQSKRNNDREIFLSKLKTKTQLEVLKTIIADNTYNIYYYSEEFSKCDEDIINQLNSLEKQILIDKLNNSRGPWRILRKKIRNSLNNIT